MQGAIREVNPVVIVVDAKGTAANDRQLNKLVSCVHLNGLPQ